MFKKSNKKRPKIDETQLNKEDQEEVGFHINKPLLIICIILLIIIVVLSIVVAKLQANQ